MTQFTSQALSICSSLLQEIALKKHIITLNFSVDLAEELDFKR